MFREETIVDGRQLNMMKIEEVVYRPSTSKPGEFETVIKYAPMDDSPADREILLRNKAITDMRAEIKKGPDWLGELNWCLRLASDVTDPVITGSHAVVLEGRAATRTEAMAEGQYRIFFPLCWRACLIGSRTKADKIIDTFQPADLRSVREPYLKSANGFAYSPLWLTA
jgi:hypothetical protein